MPVEKDVHVPMDFVRGNIEQVVQLCVNHKKSDLRRRPFREHARIKTRRAIPTRASHTPHAKISNARTPIQFRQFVTCCVMNPMSRSLPSTRFPMPITTPV